MRRLTPIVAVALVGACSGGSGPVLDREALRAALLTERDLPGAYETAPPDAGQDQDERFCDAAPTVGPRHEVEANFRASAAGPFARNSLESYARGQAETSFDGFLDAIEGCTRWTTELEGRQITATIERIPHEHLADQSVALRATVREPFPLVLEAIGFRRGDVIGGIAVFAVGERIDPSLAPALAARSLAKVDATLS